MNNYRGYFLVVFAFLFLTKSLSAQTYSSGRESKKVDEDFTELAEYYAKHPLPVVKRLPFDEDEEDNQRYERTADPSKVHMIQREAARPGEGTPTPSYLPASTGPTDTFLSTKSNLANIPPDTHGDIDATYCVTAINTNVHIQRRNGSNAQLLSLGGFWASVLPSGTDPFDPRVHYDPHYQRWIIVTDAVDQTTMGKSYLLIAVSTTCDPRGVWHKYAVSVDPTNNSWLDYPNVGFNDRWIVVCGNIFPNVSGGPGGASVYAFDYVSIMSGSGAPYQRIDQPSSFSICPAITYDSTQQNMFLLEVANAGSGQLQLWKLSGSTSAPVMDGIGVPTSSTHWHRSGPGGNDFAQQVGTTNKIDAGDTRIHRVIYRNKHLWCAHNAFLPSSSTATRCAAMWWEIDTLGTPIQNGLIDDPVTPGFYIYPSIAVNEDDDALVGFGYLNKNIHPSCAYALHMHTDPLDSMRAPFVYRHGQATYFENFGGGKNRWGDYSAACVDPRDNLDFWTIQESSYVGTSPNWDTWWAHIRISSDAYKLEATKDTIVINVPDTISHPGVPQCGASFRWDFGGGTSVPGSGSGPQSVKWTTPGWKQVTLVDSGSVSAITYIDSIYVKNGVAVSILNHEDENVQIMPNPNNGTFEILFNKPVTTPVNFRLINLEGRVVYAHQYTGVNVNAIPIETRDLPEGVYIANINVDGKVITQKLTIAR